MLMIRAAPSQQRKKKDIKNNKRIRKTQEIEKPLFPRHSPTARFRTHFTPFGTSHHLRHTQCTPIQNHKSSWSNTVPTAISTNRTIFRPPASTFLLAVPSALHSQKWRASDFSSGLDSISNSGKTGDSGDSGGSCGSDVRGVMVSALVNGVGIFLLSGPDLRGRARSLELEDCPFSCLCIVSCVW